VAAGGEEASEEVAPGSAVAPVEVSGAARRVEAGFPVVAGASAAAERREIGKERDWELGTGKYCEERSVSGEAKVLMNVRTTLFSENEREEIRRAVEAAEVTTSGEIVALTAPESDRYREAEVLGGILLSGLLTLIVGILLHHVTVWFFVPVIFVLFYPCRLLFIKVPWLKRSLLTRSRLESAVRERCIHAFYEKGLHRTRDETGVLIFISLLERKVWIIGDRGINERIAPETWHELAWELTNGIKEGRACAALVGVIGGCGKILTEHFPRKVDDINELPDEVIG
jgi:putative membrane protein